MKYQQPFGVLDPDASYENGNRVTGTKGSVPPAAAIEQPLRELDHLIDYAGIVPANEDLQQVRKAIEALISAETGGGDVSQFLTLLMARARLPIFPEIQTADGRMNVSSPGAGTTLVPPAVTFQHRGIFPASTSDYPEVDRTFATVANKTYHCRWTYGAGFSLVDVANAAYNPSALAEANAAFDSTYDSMLIARVVTNGSNVATITNLANKSVITTSGTEQGTNARNAEGNGARFDFSHAWNLARAPTTFDFYPVKVDAKEPVTDSDYNVVGQSSQTVVQISAASPNLVFDRYGFAQMVMSDGAQTLWMRYSARA